MTDGRPGGSRHGSPAGTTAALSPATSAERYWRVACGLASAHLFGWPWPPGASGARRRVVGHWGCNPGIAWIAGHVAARSDTVEPVQVVLGTGHASSYLFAQLAIAEQRTPEEIAAACARYGMPGGDPAELLGERDVPYSGGELGPGLGVSQGLAAAGPAGGLVLCIVGDGECETPVALAALAHSAVLLREDGAARRSAWLPAVNANGARMGGAARFDAAGLEALLAGFGYAVVTSGDDPAEASEAAAAAVAGCRAGRPTAWVSVTEKGWPAPAVVGGRSYRGHAAHKAPADVRRGDPLSSSDRSAWLAGIGVDDLLDRTGRPPGDVVATARRLALRATPTPRPARLPRQTQALSGPPYPWRAPMTAVDAAVADLGTTVFSPDEASSNGLVRCHAAGLVTEVLAEELCAAWAWGVVEAGRPAALVTYEAFAPLVGSTLAQYAKLVTARPPRGTPALLVLATSLGWANTPTHQNTDLTATLLARPSPDLHVVYPVGATSAARRVKALHRDATDGIGLVVCSKQHLPDLPDPGSPVVSYRLPTGPAVVAALLAVGDVVVAEALAAATEAAGRGVGVEVLAIVDLSRAARALAAERDRLGGLALLGAVWCAPRHVAGVLWEGAGRVFPLAGYEERWGPTAAETLRANGLDRWSLLAAVQRGLATGPPVTTTSAPSRADPGVPVFECPDLLVRAVAERGAE